MKKTWLRLALASLAVTSLGGALAIGCTGDDTTPAVLPDAGNDQNVVDTGKPDTTPIPDAGDASTPARAKVIIVHAGPGLPPIRFCFAIGLKADGSDGIIAPLAPQPDQKSNPAQPFAGVFNGTGGPFPDLGLDLSNKALTPYLILASKITTDVKGADGGSAPVGCDTLIETDAGLVAGDIIKLPTIPAGTLANDTTVLLAATGCIASDPVGVGRCGSTWNNTTGNVAIKGFVLDRKVADAGTMGVQVAHLSSATQGLLQGGATTGVNTALADTVADAATSLTTSQVWGELKPATAVAAPLPNAAGTLFMVTVNNPSADGGAPVVTAPYPLDFVVKTSTGISDAGATPYFHTGANFTFVILGDPTASKFLDDAGTIFNTGYLHAVAFPSNP